MNKTVKELEIGKEYIFIEANPDKSKDLNIVRTTLTENGECKRGWFPVFVEKETQGEIFIMFNHEQANEPLNKTPLVIHVNSNYDNPEANETLERLFGTWAKPIGYIICDADSINVAINDYNKFLNDSLTKYEENIKNSMADFNNKKQLYKQQIEWLNNNLK